MNLQMDLFNSKVASKGLLALDLATTTGFCMENEFGTVISGRWNFSPKTVQGKKLPPQSRLKAFRDRIIETIKIYGIKRIVYESPVVIKGSKAKPMKPNFVAFHLAGVLELTAYELGVPVMDYAPLAVKKFATGKGRAEKEEVVNAVKLKWGVDAIDHNEADAVALYYYTNSVKDI